VEIYDERFTTKLAARDAIRRDAAEDARAAAHLLESYLTWTSTSRR
jgi:RNase H-fold protein (predicted Holliday junction resolvase)